MNLTEKLELARKLQSLGVDIIEAGFPIASEGDYAAVKAVAAECQGVTVAALCRTAEQDVRRAAEALRNAARPRIHTFCATSDIDRKSTRLNSSHLGISYAVFCLKKKKT